MKLSKRQLRRIIRRSIQESLYRDPLSRFGTVENFLQTVIWPCYQQGMNSTECFKSALGVEEMQFMIRHKEDILKVNDDPDFVYFSYEVAQKAYDYFS